MPESINSRSILAKVLASDKTRRVAYEKVRAKFEQAHAALIEEFEQSPVTQELEAGPMVEQSRVLPGGYGNLFSFLGFMAGDRPTEPVRELLRSIRLYQKPTLQEGAWVFRISVPDQRDLDEASPMRWETRSWIDAVTRGIGTFSHYMFSLTNNRFTKSESGTAVQVKPNLRTTAAYFSGVGYVIGMLGRFKRKLTN